MNEWPKGSQGSACIVFIQSLLSCALQDHSWCMGTHTNSEPYTTMLCFVNHNVCISSQPYLYVPPM